jgi:ATP-binding cassette, subfamily B, bacterial
MQQIDSDAAEEMVVRRRSTALLKGADASEAVHSPHVFRLLKHREHTVRTRTEELEAYVAHEHSHHRIAQVAKSAQPLVQACRTLWQRLLQHVQRRRVLALIQMSMIECGAACLAMILSYYGRKTTISEVRESCGGVGRDGLSALVIVKAARAYGLRVRVVSLKENDFRFVILPAIVHWEFNHFLIVEHWSPRYVDLVDPALGRRRVTAQEFDNSFTGIVITLEPGAHFSRASASRARTNLWSYLRQYVRSAPASFGQILGTSLLLQLFGLAIPAFTKVVMDRVIPFGLHDALTLLGIGLLIVLLAQLVTTLLRASVLTYLRARVDTKMMLGFFEQLLMLPQRFFQQRSSGDILARLNSNIVIRDTISNQFTSTILDGSFVMVYFLILLSQSLMFSLAVLMIGLIQVSLLLGTTHLIHDLAKRELVAQGKSQGYIAEALVGIATLKSAGAEQRALEHWSNLFYEQMNVSVRRSYLSSLISTALSMLSTFAPLLLLWLGTMQVLNGTMQVGTMLALNALAIAFLAPLSSLASSGQQLQLIHSHLERIADVMEAEPEQDSSAVQMPPPLSGGVSLQQVSFQYDPHSPLVLHGINIDIHPGQKVALVGRSGSGKSTLGNLLLGLFLPTSGEVIYDGMPLSTLNYQAVRSQFGVVMQAASVFSGSIRENIALNDPAMGLGHVIKAAQMAAIHDDIMQMPMEYETFVSEGGCALSGGQRQRLALARALAHGPIILLLDEATSALDVVTEQIIEHNLRTLDCTQIIIAHRLSTIRNADVILVLDQGTIVENGSHEELLRRDGFYAKLIQSQLASGEIKTA